MYNKVFISYAAEDFQYADKLHKFLSENGFEPWMDKKDLLPGQNWDLMIQEALQKADFILLLLSSTSVGKRGYVQKEFNQAVIYCEEKLDSDIYIIPIKIDACQIPFKLNKFQWVEYSSTDYQNKILQAINFQRSIVIKEEESRKHKIAGFESDEKNVKGEYVDKSPKQTYDIRYPQFKNIEAESLKELNLLIQNDVLKYLIRSRDNYFNHLKGVEINKEEEGWGMFEADSTCYGTINLHFISKNFISYTSFWSLYETGCAHGNYWSKGNNYLINPLRNLELEELFENFESSLGVLRDCIHDKLMVKAKTEYEEDVSEYFYVYDHGFEAEKKNFRNYYFKNDSIVFIYNPYELTAWSMGDHHPEISFTELINLFPNEKKLHQFIDTIQTKN
ncbi:MAG: hypothetical protein K0R26_582 [Bacteroidota bacterium]|jgi:hypothetical protein|nr:hypothetical protein [Bacteroidota bacterium]